VSLLDLESQPVAGVVKYTDDLDHVATVDVPSTGKVTLELELGSYVIQAFRVGDAPEAERSCQGKDEVYVDPHAEVYLEYRC